MGSKRNMVDTTESMHMGRGRPPKVTPDELLAKIRDGDEPVWTAKEIAELGEISRPTAGRRLDELVERGDLRTKEIGNSTVYYLGDSRSVEQRHRESIVEEFSDAFVGDMHNPEQVSGVFDDVAGPGDEVQLQVAGTPGNWHRELTRVEDNRLEELPEGEEIAKRTQALISGTLYTRPTVPIEHENYAPDYDLELNIGGQYQEVEGRSRPILVAAGVKNYLIKPCNDALFLEAVSVDWISPKGEGNASYRAAEDEVARFGEADLEEIKEDLDDE